MTEFTERARIRMYRCGLGDCFLVTLYRRNDKPFNLLTDCGMAIGSENADTRLQSVLGDVLSTTGGTVDVLVATHEHWDHLSGFVLAPKQFRELQVGQVWLPWTEDPKDQTANRLREERAAALNALRLRAARLALDGRLGAAAEVNSILDFFGAAGDKTTKLALEALRAKTTNIRYCRPTDRPWDPPGVQARIYVLGPPLDQTFLMRSTPSRRNADTYGPAMDTLLFEVAPGEVLAAPDSPFGTLHAIPMHSSQDLPFFKANYWAADAWRRIDGTWLDSSAALALQLDNATNNTCLVLAIELEDGDVLLFPGDAQIGSWQSWATLKWTRDGELERTGPGLLSRTIVYKVGHHGSHNATLRQAGLELMDRLQYAMLPVDEAAAHRRGWKRMPEPDLITALERQSQKGLLRADIKPPESESDLYYEVFV